ncbi:MAG: VC0807 family protein [Bdellovibrionota bacterium]
MLLNLACNIAIPVFILNKFSSSWGAITALLVSLAFPLGFGLWELYRTRKFNFISIFGMANILLTGGLALLNISGPWFAVKEAAVPLLIGIFVLASEWVAQPMIRLFFLNPQVVKVEVLIKNLAERKNEAEFERSLRYFNRWLALSFFFSACLNFGLAIYIFTPITEEVGSDAQKQILNGQIASMTQWSWPIIAIPSMIFLAVLLYFFFKKC